MDGFTAAKAIQERVAAGEAVDRELLRAMALAVLAGTKAGRIALAVLRSVSDEECLSWALELSDVVLANGGNGVQGGQGAAGNPKPIA